MHNKADLHLHTTASDGRLSPAEVVQKAKALGLSVIAITDHDTTAGLAEAREAASLLSITLIQGIELSCGGAEEVHLLGYGIEPENPDMVEFLGGLVQDRRERMERMLIKAQAMGMSIRMDDLSTDSPSLGRMHLAHAMIQKGYAGSVREAFAKYLGVGKPLYIDKKLLPVSEGIRRLSGACAVVSLAHPGRLHMGIQSLLNFLPAWAEEGLCAIEAYHESHDAGTARYLDGIARRMGLMVTGGSDCHGSKEGLKMGLHMPMWRSIDEDIQALLRCVST